MISENLPKEHSEDEILANVYLKLPGIHIHQGQNKIQSFYVVFPIR